MSRKKKIIISVILVMTATVTGFAAWILDGVKAPEVAKEVVVTTKRTGSVVYDGEEITSQNLGRREGIFTILVAGLDKVSQSTDTIMLATFDTNAKKISVLSIPRDTITRVKRSNKKINSAYAAHSGDIFALYDEVESVTGIRPDKYALVRVEGFVKLIDALGGVAVDVPVDMHYSDPEQNLTIDIDKGVQVLDGYDSMGFMRYRKNYALGDIGRIQVQHTFIKALADKMLCAETIPKIPVIMEIILENVETDLTLGNGIWLGKEFVSMDFESDIRTDTLPGYGEYYKGLSYYFVNEEETLELINEHYSPFEKRIESLNLFKK
ncbi:MAG: LytR family transcriptional regulator [Ruminococcaceae bacterium]|nr:LytR family transcriptional regulator [Oscillospiraceae bacterium]